jgi:hypothetical protein
MTAAETRRMLCLSLASRRCNGRRCRHRRSSEVTPRGTAAGNDHGSSAALGYDRWREFDPEDSLRFYTLRMQETGMIKSSPKHIIADGTDWRFLDELKRELKS